MFFCPRAKFKALSLGDRWKEAKDALDVLRHVKSPKALMKAALGVSVRDRRVLNLRPSETLVKPPSAASLAQQLRALRNELKVEAIDDHGRVNYARLRSTALHRSLEEKSAQLRYVRPEQLSGDAERIAFFINVYNVLAIHGVLALKIEDSVMEQPAFFSTIAYQIGDWSFTPDELENGLLRRNAPHPVTHKRCFPEDAPQLAFCPSYVDPRIHAALVCASKSCPPVAFYEAEALDSQLDRASANYVQSEVRVDAERRILSLPIVFRYYAVDFGDADSLQNFLIEHADPAQGAALKDALQRGFKREFQRYDWSLNHFV